MKTIVPYNGPLAHLKDLIFRSLPEKDAQAWFRLFLSVIEPGVDLWSVWYRWVAATLREDLLTLPAVKAHPQVLSSIQHVMELYDRAGNGMKIEDVDWKAAHDQASEAWKTTKEERASTAAWAAGWLVTARKANGESVRMGVNAAAYAARESARMVEKTAWEEEGHRLYQRMGDRLIGLLKVIKEKSCR